MSDTIYRQDVLNELDGCDYELKDWQRWKLKTMVRDIPSAQPEPCDDLVSREAVSEWLKQYGQDVLHGKYKFSLMYIWKNLMGLPSAQPEIIRCKDCIYYDPPHVENNGVRYEYDEMQADAFDALGTGLVNAEYGINIGGRCCVDYYCKNYSDDKRVFVREDNYCGRAERRSNETD